MPLYAPAFGKLLPQFRHPAVERGFVLHRALGVEEQVDVDAPLLLEDIPLVGPLPFVVPCRRLRNRINGIFVRVVCEVSDRIPCRFDQLADDGQRGVRPGHELAVFGEELVDVLVAAESAVEDEAHPVDAEDPRLLEEVDDRLHIRNVARNLPVVEGKVRLLAEEKRKVDLRQRVGILVLPPADLLERLRVARDRRRVEGPVFVVRPAPRLEAEELHALGLADRGEQLAAPLRRDVLAEGMDVRRRPPGEPGQRVGVLDDEVIGHGQDRLPGVREATPEILRDPGQLANGVEKVRRPSKPTTYVRNGRMLRRLFGEHVPAVPAATVGRNDLAGLGIQPAEERALGARLPLLLVPERLRLVDVGDSRAFVQLFDLAHLTILSLGVL